MLRKFLVAAASAAALLSSVAVAQDLANPAPLQDARTLSQPEEAPLTAPVLQPWAAPVEAPAPTPGLEFQRPLAAPVAVEPIQYQQPTQFPQTTTAQAQSGGWGGARANLYGRAYAGIIIGGQAEVDATGTTQTGPILGLASDDDLEIGWQAGYALGLHDWPARNWRLEIEGFYADTETDDGIDFIDEITDDDDADGVAAAEVTIFGGMVNALYDFDYYPVEGWRPFLGAGIGYGRVKAEFEGAEAKDEAFLWQIMAGVGYDFGNGQALEFSYRYLNAGSADFDSDDGIDFEINGDVEVDQHALLAAYRYRWF